MFTIQETFDAAARGIIAQGGPSANRDGTCFYRHPQMPRKCAAGHLIPDDEYDSNFEGLPSTIIDPLRHHNRQLVREMQRTHDNCAIGWTCRTKHDARFMAEWRSSMTRLAERWGLSVAVLREEAQ